MLLVRGHGDDLVTIQQTDRDGAVKIDCHKKDVLIHFDDDTIIRVGYPKPDAACWWIEVERQGTAHQALMVCSNEDSNMYGDVFYIGASAIKVRLDDQKYMKVGVEL